MRTEVLSQLHQDSFTERMAEWRSWEFKQFIYCAWLTRWIVYHYVQRLYSELSWFHWRIRKCIWNIRDSFKNALASSSRERRWWALAVRLITGFQAGDILRVRIDISEVIKVKTPLVSPWLLPTISSLPSPPCSLLASQHFSYQLWAFSLGLCLASPFLPILSFRPMPLAFLHLPYALCHIPHSIPYLI